MTLGCLAWLSLVSDVTLSLTLSFSLKNAILPELTVPTEITTDLTNCTVVLNSRHAVLRGVITSTMIAFGGYV